MSTNVNQQEHVQSRSPGTESTSVENSSFAVRSRVLIGAAGLLAIGHRVYAAEQGAGRASDFDATAVQIVRVWTPHLFYMLMIVAILIALYVITRSRPG